MLLRSSSTPLLGSLLSSISESSSHHNSEVHHATAKHPPPTIYQNHKQHLSFHHQTGSPYYTFSCNSSPISPSVSDHYFSVGTKRSENGIRRAQSEGNLQEGLANASSNPDEFCMSIPVPKRLSSGSSMLETIPSFSFHSARNRYEEENSDMEEEEEEEEEGGFFVNSLVEQNSMGARGGDLTLEKQNLCSNDDMRFLDSCGGGGIVLGENKERIPDQMHLARGLRADDSGTNNSIGFGGGGGGDSGGGSAHNTGADGEGFNGPGMEEHYKTLVEENPGNPLFLRNYAQFLYQSKRDLPRAEEYYSRAILADSRDGEILSQYAKLIWELHHDQDRALSYFERAVRAAPQDSHVQAAYASFLWEADEGEDDEADEQNVPSYALPSHFCNGVMAAASTA